MIGDRPLVSQEQNNDPLAQLNDRCNAGSLSHALFIVGGAIGLLGIIVALLLGAFTDDGWRRFGFAYVTNYGYFLSIALGALCFVAIQHVTRSAWSVSIRRVAEIIAATLPFFAVLFIPILVIVLSGKGEVYPWAQPVPAHVLNHENEEHAAADNADYRITLAAEDSEPEAAEQAHEDAEDSHEAAEAAHSEPHSRVGHYDELTYKKRPYLNNGFFIVRWVLYFLIWSSLALFFLKNSRKQDETGNRRLSVIMEKVGAPGLVLFALTTTFAAFDLLMSLDPHWFSTIFGVYFFAGGMMGLMATLIVAMVVFKKQGLLATSLNVEHQHDLGKFLFVFVFFWGYIAFSQYMLIWYGNLPEETGWFVRRGGDTGQPNAWSIVLLILLFGQLLIPFAGLLSRHVKRSMPLLFFWSVWLLVMHWIDIWWLVMPEYSSEHLIFGLPEIACLLGIGGLFLAALGRIAGDRSLLPLRDPRLAECLNFKNM